MSLDESVGFPTGPVLNGVATISSLGLPTPNHKRTYQACIPCRRRKVRCDLGPVDNPADPPCARCRREGKDCHFSATRRKRTVGEDDELVQDDYTARNGRKRLMFGERGENDSSEGLHRAGSFGDDTGVSYADVSPSIAAHSQLSSTADGQSQSPRTAASLGYASLSQHRSSDSRNTQAAPPYSHDSAMFHTALSRQEPQHVTNETAAEFLSKEINGPGDALHLLFEAAGRTGDLNRHSIDRNTKPVKSSSPTNTTSHLTTTPGGPKPGVDFVDPAITAKPTRSDDYHTRAVPGFHEAIQAWSRLRFVRAGWFTAREAMLYIEYFYKFLAPLTPIYPPDFRTPSTHTRLLSEEPVLAVTFLTIASRYMKLDGLGGTSRSFTIHEMLWPYLRGMIERLVWGQEQFGGGFCGAGAEYATLPAGLKPGGLRTVGTVESLLLLTEWHPRALHFPPSHEENEILVSAAETGSNSYTADQATAGHTGGSEGRPALSDWLEPAWRSDRMCWMLLFAALGLAFELGMFDGMDRTSPYGSETAHTVGNGASDPLRVSRVRRLLFIYVTQTAGRLNWTSPLPRYMTDSTFFKTPGYMAHEAKETLRHRSQGSGQFGAPDTTNWISKQDMLMDKVHSSWMEITTLMKRANELLFPSREQTRETIRSGRYLSLLETFQPLLRGWRSDFDKLDIPNHMTYILLIEYEYSRLYINSLALQAVVERWTSTAGDSAQRNRALSIRGGVPNGIVSMATLLDLYRGNEEYIGEVIQASRNILRVVVDGLLPDDYLKHTPVRTYFRVLSAAMFLLKTFALGAKEDDVAVSLSLMDRTINALRKCVVDDVHLSIRIADLLDTLTSSIRTKFVRLAANNNNNPSNNYNGPSRGRTPMPTTSADHSPRPNAQDQSSTPYMNPGNTNGSSNPYAYNSGFAGRPAADALAGIATESIDPTDTTVIFMPPPDFSSSNAYYDTSTTNNNTNINNEANTTPFPDDGGTGSGGYMPDWLALPLDPLLNVNVNVNVNSSGTAPGSGAGGFAQGGGGGGAGGGGGGGGGAFFGPDVANFDMLDILLNDCFEFEGRGWR